MTEQQYLEAQQGLFKSLALGLGNNTVVPVRATYVNVARCLTIVHLLDEHLAHSLSENVIAALRKVDGGHYWYPPHDLHLTLKNIRSAKQNRIYTSDEVSHAVSAMERASCEIEPLDFVLQGLTCFPTSIVLRAYGTLKHRDAVQLLNRELDLAGIPDDKTYVSNKVFIGNITICRFTAAPTEALQRAVAACENMQFGRKKIKTMQLVECDEVCSIGSRTIHTEIKFAEPCRVRTAHADPSRGTDSCGA